MVGRMSTYMQHIHEWLWGQAHANHNACFVEGFRWENRQRNMVTHNRFLSHHMSNNWVFKSSFLPSSKQRHCLPTSHCLHCQSLPPEYPAPLNSTPAEHQSRQLLSQNRNRNETINCLVCYSPQQLVKCPWEFRKMLPKSPSTYRSILGIIR